MNSDQNNNTNKKNDNNKEVKKKKKIIKFNHPYTYAEICELFYWEKKIGNSKKAQLKELSRCFDWYYPTKNNGKDDLAHFVITKQYSGERPGIPSKKNNGGAHNIKNIKLMDEMLFHLSLAEGSLETYYTYTTWMTKIFKLVKISYFYTYSNGISLKSSHMQEISDNVGCTYLQIKSYIFYTKYFFNQFLLNALTFLAKENRCTFRDGYTFSYIYFRKRSKSKSSFKGQISTDSINDAINEIENDACDILNIRHGIDKKKKGKEIIFKVLSNKKYNEEYNDLRYGMCLDNKYHQDAFIDILKDSLLFNKVSTISAAKITNNNTMIDSYARSLSIDTFYAMPSNRSMKDVKHDLIEKIHKRACGKISKKFTLDKTTGEKICLYDEKIFNKLKDMIFNYEVD